MATPPASDVSGNDPGKPTCFDKFAGTTIPCTDPTFGFWVPSYNCYAKLAAPQPPKTDSVWNGHDDGSIYDCVYNGTVTIPGTNGIPIWLAGPPPGVVDPIVLAQQAIETMRLHAIYIGIAPEPGAGRMGYVGLPTYLWVDQPAATTLGPITKSATAGAVTVTATAHVESITWDMGDGYTVRCAGSRAKGTPYRAAYGANPSPTCGHQYQQPSSGEPGGEYKVTATSHWIIDWIGGGATGTIEMDLTAATQIRIGEIQVLVQ
ncbi:MAG: hypothetical protein QOE58_338 [Actinomycetota bacterium]|nr:hypothetical protein [Actinomycetota bacterium]